MRRLWSDSRSRRPHPSYHAQPLSSMTQHRGSQASAPSGWTDSHFQYQDRAHNGPTSVMEQRMKSSGGRDLEWPSGMRELRRRSYDPRPQQFEQMMLHEHQHPPLHLRSTQSLNIPQDYHHSRDQIFHSSSSSSSGRPIPVITVPDKGFEDTDSPEFLLDMGFSEEDYSQGLKVGSGFMLGIHHSSQPPYNSQQEKSQEEPYDHSDILSAKTLTQEDLQLQQQKFYDNISQETDAPFLPHSFQHPYPAGSRGQLHQSTSQSSTLARSRCYSSLNDLAAPSCPIAEAISLQTLQEEPHTQQSYRGRRAVPTSHQKSFHRSQGTLQGMASDPHLNIHGPPGLSSTVGAALAIDIPPHPHHQRCRHLQRSAFHTHSQQQQQRSLPQHHQIRQQSAVSASQGTPAQHQRSLHPTQQHSQQQRQQQQQKQQTEQQTEQQQEQQQEQPADNQEDRPPSLRSSGRRYECANWYLTLAADDHCMPTTGMGRSRVNQHQRVHPPPPPPPPPPPRVEWNSSTLLVQWGATPASLSFCNLPLPPSLHPPSTFLSPLPFTLPQPSSPPFLSPSLFPVRVQFVSFVSCCPSYIRHYLSQLTLKC